MNSRNDYRKAYEAAATELEGLLQQQDKTEERILALRKTMNVLSTLLQQAGEEIDEERLARFVQTIDASLTDDIAKIVSYSADPMTTSDVRNELNKLGGSLAEHSNPLATINAILGRLTEQGKIQEVTKDGRRAWKRLGSIRHIEAFGMIPPPPGISQAELLKSLESAGASPAVKASALKALARQRKAPNALK